MAKLLIIFLALIAVLGVGFTALYFFVPGLLSLGDASVPDCNFPTGGGECIVNVTLPADRTFITLTPTTSWESVPASVYGGRTRLSPIASSTGKTKSTSTNTDVTLQLYRTPATWKNVQEVYVETSLRAQTSCGSGDVGQAYGDIFALPFNYTGTTIATCYSSSSSLCKAPWIVRDYSPNYNVNGQSVGSSGSVARCSTSKPNVDATLNYTGIIPYEDIFGDTASFVIQSRGADAGGTVNTIPQDVWVSYRRAEYPTDVSYYAGGRYVSILLGEQKKDVTLLDLADQANTYCNRPSKGNQCVVPVRFTSKSAGKLWVKFTDTQKINSATAPVVAPVTPTPVYVNPTPNPVQPPVVTPTPAPAPAPVTTQPVTPVPVTTQPVTTPTTPTPAPAVPIDAWYVRFIDSIVTWFQNLIA